MVFYLKFRALWFLQGPLWWWGDATLFLFLETVRNSNCSCNVSKSLVDLGKHSAQIYWISLFIVHWEKPFLRRQGIYWRDRPHHAEKVVIANFFTFPTLVLRDITSRLVFSLIIRSLMLTQVSWFYLVLSLIIRCLIFNPLSWFDLR